MPRLKLVAVLSLAMLSAACTSLQDTTTHTAGNEPQVLAWTDLAPEPDSEVLKNFHNGKLSSGQLRSYINDYYQTPQPELSNHFVTLTGYLLPQNVQSNGASTEFALVKHITSWSHTDQQLKPNQVVRVKFTQGLTLNQSTRVRYKVSGIMHVGQYDMPVTKTFYLIEATDISPSPKGFNEKY